MIVSDRPHSSFHDLDPALFDRVLTDVVEQDLLRRIEQSSPGSCLRVSTLPGRVMNVLAERLYNSQPAAHIRLLLAEGDAYESSKPWQVKATQLIALRNAGDKPLLVFIPPGLRTSAEDSFDVSTFAEIQLGTIGRTIHNSIFSQLPSDLQVAVQHLLDQLEYLGVRHRDDQVVRYLLTVLENGADAHAAGRSLYQLGLVPDLQLFADADPDGITVSLRQNLKAVQALADAGAPLVARIYRLNLEPETVQLDLHRFLGDFTPEDVIRWGRAIATDPQYVHLSFDNWPFITATPECLLYVQELKLPVRQDIDGAIKVLNPNNLAKGNGLSISWETDPQIKQITTLDHFHIELVNSGGLLMYHWRVSPKATKRQTYKIKDIAEIGLQPDLYFFRVRALTADDAVINIEDRKEQGVSRNPSDPESKRINETEEFLYTEEEGPDPPPPDARNQLVSSYLEAQLNAQLQAIDKVGTSRQVRQLVPEKAAWTRTVGSTGTSGPELFNLRYNLQSSYNLSFSGMLVEIERRTLSGDDTLGRWHLNMMPRADVTDDLLTPRTTAREQGEVPELFAQARRSLFEAIRSTPEITEEEDSSHEGQASPSPTMITATVDLLPLAAHIESYLEAYANWLEGLSSELSVGAQVNRCEEILVELQLALNIDSVKMVVPRGVDDAVDVLLLAPTHPVRLWWHLQWQRLAAHWVDSALTADKPKEAFTDSARALLRTLTPRHLPQLQLDMSGRFYIDNGPLTHFWQLYVPVNLADSHATRAYVAQALALKQGSTALANSISSDELLRKLNRYLLQHPYVSTLHLNVFNPGDAASVANAVVALQDFRPDLKYTVNLFASNSSPDLIGSAFEALFDPNRQVSEAKDEFAMPSRNHLYPKLRLTRNRLDDFIAEPERFSAHLSLLLNLFPVDIRLESAIDRGRSSYIHGLVQEPVTWFVGKGHVYSWNHQLYPTANAELPSAPGATQRIASVLTHYANAQATVAEGRYREDSRPTVQLNLDLTSKSLLYQIHEASDWVLIVDSNLGLEYFDASPEPERPIYLLDFTPQYLAAAGERLLLTTRSTDEILNIIRPALAGYGINEGEGQELSFLYVLRSLSGRLALQLLAAPNQADEAISLALSRIFLEQYELLSDRLVIPLDAHQSLFSDSKNVDFFDSALSMRRSDLLMVEVEPNERTLVFHLLEVKSRRHGVGIGLEQDMEEQLSNARDVLKYHFDPNIYQPDRLDRAFKTKELVSLLTFYLERAKSYNLVNQATADQLYDFFITLDEGYKLRFVTKGLVFDLSAQGIKISKSSEETTYYYIGLDYINLLVQNHLRTTSQSLVPLAESQAEPPATGQMPLMQRDPSYSQVRDNFTTTSFGVNNRRATHGEQGERGDSLPPLDSNLSGADDPFAGDHTEQGTPSILRPNDHSSPAVSGDGWQGDVAPDVDSVSKNDHSEASLANDTGTDASADVPTDTAAQETPSPSISLPPNDDGAQPEPASTPLVDVLLGDTHLTGQYGVLGVGSGKVVGLDLDGVNTISLFGVQGAGKSYTMGTVVEMATQPIPKLNILPDQLATVIFHYHEAQEYAPEFVSMVDSNDEPDELQKLRNEFGAEPAKLSDVIVLTTADTLDARRREFPNVEVHPIYFRSSELTSRDWLFLMGAVGNQSMYLNQISKIMRDNRNDLTLENIRLGVESSRLSEAQKSLADIRLDFAAEFINDDAEPLATRLKPGRLVIVDLRDELIPSEQALGLFVVMLKIFAGVESYDGRGFNKLIVFDEAHKYMTGGDLTDQVVSVIRQMRHQGVSILIASQDPPSLPNTVIELSSVVILHRFNSPNWLKHIQKSVIALHDLTSAQLSLLKPGEAYVWANKATEPLFTQKAVKIRLRPRATRHGGGTKTASRD
jgi:DNA phosphorothioation-dependent restriction protein DptH